MLGCGKGEDSIEHYWCCPVVRETGRKMLKIDAEADLRKANVFGVACWALLTYAVYMTTNASRKHGGHTGKVQEMMQHVRQAVEGQKGSTASLKSRWMR